MLIQVAYGREGKGARPYTYSSDEPVQVGDIVLVPPTLYRDQAGEAVVVALGSTYDGPVTPILRVIERVK